MVTSDRRESSTLRVRGLSALLGVFLGGSLATAADLEEGRALFRTGRYDECVRLAEDEANRIGRDEAWSALKIRSELARGRYEAALVALDAGVDRSPSSIELRLLGRDVYRFNGQDEKAAKALEAIERLVLSSPQRYASAEGRVAIGRFALIRGADAKKVLTQFYDIARRQRPDFLESYFATAELALEKQDDALAAESLREAPEEAREDPRYHHLLALAFSNSDRSRAAEAIDAALAINPRHTESLLLRADHLIDAERYGEASAVLDEIFKVNPYEPRAWAYRSVIAHLRSDPEQETAAREAALAYWGTNPEVDHLIGRELSQKYRFAEGAAAQRRALEFDPAYRPAKVQLCQDLLRLGEEDEGWRLADAILAEDGYNIVGFNLVTLRDHLSEFKTLRGDGVIVRMDAREAELYGPRVLALLDEARTTLCPKYGVVLEEPVVVEIFPQQKDFAVRTFGLPGADGFLGVCFGRVITINGPAAQGSDPSNWESVLWHEFCHTVTLTKTRNKMPRWLSEGISVYEEGQRDPACATTLSPRFRVMLLGEDFTPLSDLSSAFLAPKSPVHLQFAYFESSLAVEFLVERFGASLLKDVLADLGAGAILNDSLSRRTSTSLEQLDDDFSQFARRRAEETAPNATWEEPVLPPEADSAALSEWLASHPNNFPGLQRLAATLIDEEEWSAAAEAAESLRDLFPEYAGPDNAYRFLAAIHRHRGDTAAEYAALRELVERDADAGDAFLRLAELDEASGNWAGVVENARAFLAVNPLVPAPYRSLARGSEELSLADDAVHAYRALSLLDDTDPAEIHFRLARLLQQKSKPDEALRQVLKSLEEAPRYVDAQELLLALVEEQRVIPARRSGPPVEAPKP